MSKKPDAIPGGAGANAIYRKGGAAKRDANAKPGGPNGGAGAGVWQSGGRKPAGLAIGTQGWVEQKIAEGDIAGGMASNQSGTSIFDPVLTELCYRWFCAPGGAILDPFAGGSVRGIVAHFLGREYTGIELRPEQIEANRDQASRICRSLDVGKPQWIEGDSTHLESLLPSDWQFDFVFSCPPYADLEVYSEDPRDLSTMDYPAFLTAYNQIIAAACARLKPDRFAAFVVGDVRDKGGYYRGFPWHTIAAFEAAGLRLYNEAVLVTAAGSLPMRVNRQFSIGRKLGKTHQNVLVFCKGDWRKAAEAVGPVEFGEIDTGDSRDDIEPLGSQSPAKRGVSREAGDNPDQEYQRPSGHMTSEQPSFPAAEDKPPADEVRLGLAGGPIPTTVERLAGEAGNPAGLPSVAAKYGEIL